MNHYSNNTAAFTSLTTTYCVTQSHFVGSNYIPFTQQPVKTTLLTENSTQAVEPTLVVDTAKTARLNAVGRAAIKAEQLFKAKGVSTFDITHNNLTLAGFLLDAITNGETDQQLDQRISEFKPARITPFPITTTLKCADGDALSDNAKAPDYLINSILETDSHGILSGASMAFKTFAALRLVHSVCTGNDFFGHPVFTTGKVLYVCGEGKGALSRRMKALKLTDGGFNNNLLVLDDAIRIDNPNDMAQLRQLIELNNPALVVFDTFASLVSNTDENSPSDVGKALRLIKETCRNGKTSSLIIHHHGKDASKGSRGASNFTNDVDFAFEMNRANDSMLTTLSCKKMKDGGCFADVNMLAQVVDLGLVNQDGTACTSLAMIPTDYTPTNKSTQRKLKPDDKNVLHELHNALEQFGREPTPDIEAYFAQYPRNKPKQVVHIDDLRPLVYPHFTVADASKRTVLSRSIKKLTESKNIMFYNGYLWIIS